MLMYSTATDEETWEVLCKYLYGEKGMLFVNDQNLDEERKKTTNWSDLWFAIYSYVVVVLSQWISNRIVSSNYIAILNGLFHRRRRRFIHRDDCRSMKKHAQWQELLLNELSQMFDKRKASVISCIYQRW